MSQEHGSQTNAPSGANTAANGQRQEPDGAKHAAWFEDTVPVASGRQPQAATVAATTPAGKAEPSTKLLQPAALEKRQDGGIDPESPTEDITTMGQPPAGSGERVLDSLPGTRVQQYEVIRFLGHGGMGKVYVARDTRLGRLVALKFLSEIGSVRSQRFLVEARATARLDHENIVAIHDIGVHQGCPFMALEHIEGQTLRHFLEQRRQRATAASKDRAATGIGVSPGRAAEIMLPVMRALVRAHALGVVHRDLKPANIMLTDAGSIKVLDFGLAKVFRTDEPEDEGIRVSHHPVTVETSLTGTGGLVGTMPYMSPEQWQADAVDHRSDLWAAGIILHELATGEHPLAPLSREALASVTDLAQPMPSTRTRHPELGKLATVIDRCLIKSKADRIDSARALLAELETVARPGHTSAGADDDSPYPGLAAFQERDAGRFFGRERAVQHVLGRLDEQPLVAIVGPSGAGKSSFVRAGIIPALARGDDAWETFVIRPGPHPLATLLLQHAWQSTSTNLDTPPQIRGGTLDQSGERDLLCARLRTEPGLVGVQLRARAQRKRARILLFVDQLEELYILAGVEEREAFLACLAGAVDDAGSSVRVVLAMRSDFLDRVAESRSEVTELISRGITLLRPLDRAGLRAALVRPLDAVEHRFEDPALVEEMLDALAHTRGALPLLQFTAARLWEQRDRQRRMLTVASYRALGGVAGTLASHADAVLAAMSAAERRLARAVLLRLVSPERTRALAALAELRELAGAASAAMERVLSRLIAARLLVVEHGPAGSADDDEGVVELVHESLIDRWPLLAQWINESAADAAFLARLRGAAGEWDRSGRAEGLLWRGQAAQEARRWYERHGTETRGELGKREEAYLAAVVHLIERAQRQRRRIAVSAFAVLGAIALVVSYLALLARTEAARAEAAATLAENEAARARKQAVEREREATRARNATRLAAAEMQHGDPTTALALLREVEPGELMPRWAALAHWALSTGVAHAVHRHPAHEVNAVALSPDESRFAMASLDGTVRVWNTGGAGTPQVLRGHHAVVYALTFSPDGTRIASASFDKTVRVWDTGGAGTPRVLRGHEAAVLSVAFSPDGTRVASGSMDRTIRVWHTDGGDMPLVLRGHEDGIRSVRLSPDGTHIASASLDGTIRLWSTDRGDMLRVLRGHEDDIHAVAFSPDGTRIASASLDGTVRVWDTDGASTPRVLRGHEGNVTSVAFSADGTRIASGSADRTVRVWNLGESGMIQVLQGHEDSVHAVAFSPDGMYIVSASLDGTVRRWSIDGSGTPRVPLILRGHESEVGSVAFSPDGARIASASRDRTVRVWNTGGAGTPRVLRGHEGNVTSVAFSPDGTRIASASRDRTVRVWNTGGAGTPRVLRGHEGNVTSVAFSPDGTRIASASEDRTVRVWNTGGADTPRVLRGHQSDIYGVAFSPDGTRIASASLDGTVRVWNADGAGTIRIIRGHATAVHAVAFSPDGTRIASASLDGTVRVWDADDNARSPLVLGGNSYISIPVFVAFNPDGTRIAAATWGGTVRVWNADGSGVPRVLRGHEDSVTEVAFSPDGTRIASASLDGTVRVWRDLLPIEPTDPMLWTATSYCLTIELRQALLGVTEDMARQDQAACQRRVAAARRQHP